MHGNAFGMYVSQNTVRSADAFAAVGWLMADVTGAGAFHEIGLGAMVSLDPLTLGDCGYPRLLADTSSFCIDRPFEDRSHSHAFFMDLSAHVRMDVGPAVVFARGGPVGQPPLGPPSYMHRPSALHDPIAPMSHHETNPAHVANGVVVAGVEVGSLTLEASAFNARPGDDDPYDFDVGSLSSWATHARYVSAGWTLEGSLGELHDAGGAHAGHGGEEAVRIYSAFLGRTLMRGPWMIDGGAAWVRHAGGELPVDAFLLEASAQTGRHTLFGRAERVHRVEQELVIDEAALARGEHSHLVYNYRRRVGEVAAGYSFRLLSRRGLDLSAGARAGVSFIPNFFSAYYGTSHGRSFTVFANLQPTRVHVH